MSDGRDPYPYVPEYQDDADVTFQYWGQPSYTQQLTITEGEWIHVDGGPSYQAPQGTNETGHMSEDGTMQSIPPSLGHGQMPSNERYGQPVALDPVGWDANGNHDSYPSRIPERNAAVNAPDPPEARRQLSELLQRKFCPICSRQYRRLQGMLQHLWEKHLTDKNTGAHSCEECQGEFAETGGRLLTHRRNYHPVELLREIREKAVQASRH